MYLILCQIEIQSLIYQHNTHMRAESPLHRDTGIYYLVMLTSGNVTDNKFRFSLHRHRYRASLPFILRHTQQERDFMNQEKTISGHLGPHKIEFRASSIANCNSRLVRVFLFEVEPV